MATITAETGAHETAGLPISKRARPILWWAALGVVALAVQLYGYGGWILSGDAQPQSFAHDDLSFGTKAVAWGSQIVCVGLFIGMAIYVARQCRPDRRLTFDAMLLTAWVACVWQDPLVNYVRNTFFYNSYYLNFGAWSNFIPGWVSPRGEMIPEAVVLVFFGYAGISLPIIFAINGIMRRARAVRPTIGKVGLVLVALGSAAAIDIALELFWVRTGNMAYLGTVHALSLWGGTRYQWPLYEGLFWGGVWAAIACVRFFRDDKGRTFVERGLEELRVSTRTKTWASVLAVIGFFNVAFGVYNIAWNWMSLNIDPTPPGISKALRNGICGAETPQECPGPEVPIPLRGSPSTPPVIQP